MIIRERLEGHKNNLIITKEQRLKSECDKAEYQPPCGKKQVHNAEKYQLFKMFMSMDKLLKGRQSVVKIYRKFTGPVKECS